MRLLALCVFVFVLTPSAVTGEECDPNCQDYYWKCNEVEGIPFPEPEEIDCSQDNYKLRCQRFCQVCTTCDFVLQSEFDESLQKLDERISALENQGQISS